MRHEGLSLVATVGIVMAAGLWSTAAEAAAVIVPNDASIVVRTYTPPDSVVQIRTARRIASTILGRAGIQVVWTECGAPAAVSETAADACTEPLRWNELVVRMVSAAPVDTEPHPDALGFAFVDLKTGGGWLATVYTDRVGGMAQAAGVDGAELLGRAIAHEIGHLLLGSNRHPRHGLMRASWSGADLRRNRATQWLFDGKEGEMMRRGIAARFRPVKAILSSADNRVSERLPVVVP